MGSAHLVGIIVVAAVVGGCRPADAPAGRSPLLGSSVPVATAADTSPPSTTGTTVDTPATGGSGLDDTATTTGSSGCGSPAPASGLVRFDHDGVERTYALQVPEDYDADVPTPLVLAFHGWGGSEQEYLVSPTVTEQTDARGYVLVVPRGLGAGPPDQSLNSWSFRGSTTGLDGDGVRSDVVGDTTDICDDAATGDYTYASCQGTAANGCSWTHCRDDDVDFVLDLLASLEQSLCIDPRRIYATGGSNGGMFTWELAQDPRSAPRLRAVAPLIGLPHRGYHDGKGRPDDLPVLLITGTRDATVPPGAFDDPGFTVTTDGDRYFYTGATAITQAFAASHGCDTTGLATPFEVATTAELDCRTHCGDDPGWPRVLDCRAPMGHTYQFTWAWPLILDFFDRFGV